MKDVENLLQQRKDEYHDVYNQVEGMRKVLKAIQKEFIDESIFMIWKKDLVEFVDKKEKERELMLEVCQRNIEAASGPMNDKDENENSQ